MDLWIYQRWDQVPWRSKHSLSIDHTRREPFFQSRIRIKCPGGVNIPCRLVTSAVSPEFWLRKRSNPQSEPVCQESSEKIYKTLYQSKKHHDSFNPVINSFYKSIKRREKNRNAANRIRGSLRCSKFVWDLTPTEDQTDPSMTSKPHVSIRPTHEFQLWNSTSFNNKFSSYWFMPVPEECISKEWNQILIIQRLRHNLTDNILNSRTNTINCHYWIHFYNRMAKSRKSSF
jgi:predicted CopG family antitoxin